MVKWITAEEAAQAGDREEQVLLEQTPDHYPEFGRFLRAEFDRAGGALYFRGASGATYRVAPVVGAAGRPGGIEITARMTRQGATLTQDKVDTDLWPFLEWLVTGAGGEWTRPALRQTGAIYRVPGAPPRE